MFLHVGSSKRRKLNETRVEYVGRWMNGWIDVYYIEQAIRVVFCCWLDRHPLHSSREKKKIRVRRARIA